MNKQEIKKPSVRFNNFIEDWKKIKIINFSNKTFGGATPKTSNENYWDGEIPWIQSSDLIKDKISNIVIKKKITKEGLEKSATKLVPRNSIAIVTRVGVGKVALMPFEYTTSQDFLSLSDLKVDKWFGTYSLYYKINQELNSVQGTSIKGITKKELLDRKTYIPGNIKEQSKIGGFFKQLDGIITLQQQLLDNHKQLKKAMLQKMFPQKGESVPRIRFAGYTSEWEIEPLSRLGKIMTGSTPSTLNKDNYSNEGIIWITPTDIKGRIVTKTSRKISEIGETGARIAPAGTILVTSIASIGKNTLLLTRAGFNQQINSLTPNKNNDSYFLFTQSEIWSEKMKKFASSGTMQIVNKTEFSSMKTSIPQLEEQEKIGNFFEQLDETIDLHEKKLETYQELKKAMLQKMFV